MHNDEALLLLNIPRRRKRTAWRELASHPDSCAGL